MGASELLINLRSAGFTLTLTDSGGIGIAPASALTDEDRQAIRDQRSDLLALMTEPVPACADCTHLLKGGTCSEPVRAGLVPNFGIVWPPDKYGTNCTAFRRTPPRPTEPPISTSVKLDKASADRCHTPEWTEAEMFTFTKRSTWFMRIGLRADADHLAEVLTLRDRDGDERQMCFECQNYRPGRCGNHVIAGLQAPDLSRDLAEQLQRCRGFEKSNQSNPTS